MATEFKNLTDEQIIEKLENVLSDYCISVQLAVQVILQDPYSSKETLMEVEEILEGTLLDNSEIIEQATALFTSNYEELEFEYQSNGLDLESFLEDNINFIKKAI